MSSHAMLNGFAAGILTWAALAAQTPAADEAKRGPRVHSEASESSNSTAPVPPGGLQVRAGTALQVRLNRSLSTAQTRAGDRFTATLVEPVRIEGRTVFPKGAQVTGRVEESAPSGRLRGRAHLMLALESIQVGGSNLPLETSVKSRSSQRHRKRNALWIGGGGGTGALIGGLAGGPVGMLVGAGSGAAVGAAGALVTGRKQVTLPAETLLTFRLRSPVRAPASSEFVQRSGKLIF